MVFPRLLLFPFIGFAFSNSILVCAVRVFFCCLCPVCVLLLACKLLGAFFSPLSFFLVLLSSFFPLLVSSSFSFSSSPPASVFAYPAPSLAFTPPLSFVRAPAPLVFPVLVVCFSFPQLLLSFSLSRTVCSICVDPPLLHRKKSKLCSSASSRPTGRWRTSTRPSSSARTASMSGR